MRIAPLKTISEEDVAYAGQNLQKLAKLARAGLPIGDGVVVYPPDLKLNAALKHFETTSKEIFEQRLQIYKDELYKIEPYVELQQELVKRHINAKKIWCHLIDQWVLQIKSRFWKEGFSKNLAVNLAPEVILFTNEIKAFGRAYKKNTKLSVLDTEAPELVLEFGRGELDNSNIRILRDIVSKADKNLFIPQIYEWILEGRKNPSLKIVKVTPRTLAESNTETIVEGRNMVNFQTSFGVRKLATKIYIDLKAGFGTEAGIDGVLIRGETVEDFDELALKIIEASKIHPGNPMIFQLSDMRNGFGGVGGTLALLNNSKRLERDIEVFKFARNKKNLLNACISIPFVRSCLELMKIKRELASFGISRKGTLKIFMEISTPENVVNIKEYIDLGIDGLIFDLDSLSGFLKGFDSSDAELSTVFAKDRVLMQFLEEALKKVKRDKIPFWVIGKLAKDDDILYGFIKHGVEGVIVETGEVSGMQDYVAVLEKEAVGGSASYLA